MEELANGTSRRADEGISSRSGSDAPSATIASVISEMAIDVGSGSTTKRRMEKVPQIMRRDKNTREYFDPRVVSVGPYHHGKEELQLAEKIKPIIVQSFISRSGRDMAEFRLEVLKVVDDVRSFYVEGSTEKYSDEEFAEMMLVDGLFVSALIESLTPISFDGLPRDPSDFNKHMGEHALYIMSIDVFFLLENQIPFQVLELMMSLNPDWNKLIMTMLDNIWEIMNCKDSREGQVLFDAMKSGKAKKSKESRLQPIHCFEYFWLKENKVSKSDNASVNSSKYFSFYHSFRSISQLKAKGIHARPNRSFTRAFRFKSFFFFAVLEIPLLTIGPEFVIKFSNQIAYECTPNNPNDLPTMAFIIFIKSLIDSAEDVKELRSKNILFSFYNTDEEVVKMFNSIPIFELGDISAYTDVKEKIQKHYNSKAKTWLAELIHNYFNSPWTFIAFVAAIAIVMLSFIQTYFTIYPRSSK